MKTECTADFVRFRGKIYPCTVSLAADLAGGKWKAAILYHLQDGEKRFAELRRHLVSVTEMTLNRQLKRLEQDGLIEREAFGDKPPLKVVYRLTAFGRTFMPVLQALTEWGNALALTEGRFEEKAV
ncbi:winged helix-turn-helix transcriptional regulator [Neisseria chenwenguii]|uniref:Transcriptional regulator n=1 Tax=Neisseria chenwenguii TaxID=1853278 RepID=A0A220S318_9NEIS|nr:helix-turn-helix domain-containing protein [Neisseria chenwenguii]ASK27891.1 transcriptional regulator [Neisseria chenwenguii]ROV56254.1 transcriptional regulator [Neisseria chenwenguii]